MKWSGHIYFIEDNLLYTMSKLRHVWVHVVTKVLRIFQVARCSQQTQRSENMSSCRLQEVKNDRKSLNFQAQKVVGVAYRRWSFTRGSNCKALTEKVLVFWISGRLQQMVAYERWSHIEVRLYFQGGKTFCASFCAPLSQAQGGNFLCVEVCCLCLFCCWSSE